MSGWIARTAAAVVLLAATTASLRAQDLRSLSCRELWFERNRIFKEAGFCFRTQRAIAAFGNAGCLYDRQADLPLSEYQQRLVAEISVLERRRGCGV